MKTGQLNHLYLQISVKMIRPIQNLNRDYKCQAFRTSFSFSILQHCSSKHSTTWASWYSCSTHKLCTHNNLKERQICAHISQLHFSLVNLPASTFPIPGCCKRPAALRRHGGAGGGEFLMTSLNLVAYWGRSGSCWWCLFFFFPSFCAALHNKVYEISNIRLKIQQ